MALQKRLTEEELALFEVLNHPVWCGEFLRNISDDAKDTFGEEWEYTWYQKEFMCDFNDYVSIMAGRTVGKTISIIDKLVWYGINAFWDETIVYTVPNKVHLEPVFLRLTRWFRNHPFLRHYTGRTGINSQTFTIKLNNSVVIDCRIAGQSGTGANVVGLHVPVIITDESGLYPWRTFVELLPCLNTWQEGHQLITAGVPTGRREKNVLFFMDQKHTKATKHRISAHQNPRYSKEADDTNIKQYGGKESEDYIHLVLGQHGLASYSMFDREKMLIRNYDVFHGTVYGQKIRQDPSVLNRFLASFPPAPKTAEEIMFGIDLGYVDPSVILVLYRMPNEPFWKFLVRATLRQVDYPKQEMIIDIIDSKYHPQILGIDEGSSGKAVIQHLRAEPKFKHKGYDKRIIPIQFRSNIPVGINDEGEMIEVRAKEFGMQLLQSKVNNHDICFTWKDEALISELERTTYTRTPSGELTFRTITVKGGIRHSEDHNTSALLCATIANYLATDASKFRHNRRKLWSTRWSS